MFLNVFFAFFTLSAFVAGAFATLQVVQSVTGIVAAFCNPVGLAVIGISALIAGLGVAYAKSEGFRSIVGAVVSIVKLLVVGVVEAVKKVGDLGFKFTYCLGPIGLLIEGLKKLTPMLDKFGGVSGIAGKVTSWADNKTNKIKGHALGTVSAGGGATLVGEYGPEIVNLPRGASVIPNGKTRDILNNNSNITVNLNVSGNVLGNREFFNEMMNLMAIEIRKAAVV